jgi:hypothetical protein
MRCRVATLKVFEHPEALEMRVQMHKMDKSPCTHGTSHSSLRKDGVQCEAVDWHITQRPRQERGPEQSLTLDGDAIEMAPGWRR